jgi:aspartate ammonia-lyase
VDSSTAAVTALVEYLGYEHASQLATQAAEQGKSLRDLVISQNLLTAEQYDQAVSPESVTKLGSRTPPADRSSD